MKIQTLSVKFILSFVFSLLLSACSKIDFNSAVFKKKHQKDFQVKLWQEGTRAYHFYYNHKSELDSVLAVDRGFSYVYRVYRKNGRLERVDVFDYSLGIVVSGNADFEYDARKRVIGYNYVYYPAEPLPYKKHLSVSYDSQGRLYPDPSQVVVNYNDQNDIPQASATKMTFDTYLNPLAQVPDLYFIMAEETGYWWMILPEHNSTSISINGVMHRLNNKYDGYGRLIQKTDMGPGTPSVTNAGFAY